MSQYVKKLISLYFLFICVTLKYVYKDSRNWKFHQKYLKILKLLLAGVLFGESFAPETKLSFCVWFKTLFVEKNFLSLSTFFRGKRMNSAQCNHKAPNFNIVYSQKDVRVRGKEVRADAQHSYEVSWGTTNFTTPLEIFDRVSFNPVTDKWASQLIFSFILIFVPLRVC